MRNGYLRFQLQNVSLWFALENMTLLYTVGTRKVTSSKRGLTDKVLLRVLTRCSFPLTLSFLQHRKNDPLKSLVSSPVGDSLSCFRLTYSASISSDAPSKNHKKYNKPRFGTEMCCHSHMLSFKTSLSTLIIIS